MTKEELFEDLKRGILTLALRPSQALDEIDLCARSGLSRTPLREVLQRLAGSGYVCLRKNRGASVSSMSLTTLREFYLVAPMIYASVHRLAALQASPEQIERLRAAQRSCREAARGGSAGERALSNSRFHEVSGDMADNTYLQPSYSRLLIDHARIGATFFDPRDPETARRLNASLDQHDAIIDAIERRDADQASRLAIEHMALSRDRIERCAMADALEADAEFERLLRPA